MEHAMCAVSVPKDCAGMWGAARLVARKAHPSAPGVGGTGAAKFSAAFPPVYCALTLKGTWWHPCLPGSSGSLEYSGGQEGESLL